MKIKEWAEEDRPREKMLLKGIQSLSDAELLAILIGSGNRDQTAVELSQQILRSVNNNLNALGKKSVKELTSSFRGIGTARAITIMAALELGKRRTNGEPLQLRCISSSHDVYDLFYPLLCDLPHEELWIALLNRSNKVIERLKISQGGVGETAVDLRIILKAAITTLCSGIILCHNHPSGNGKPSIQDDALTHRLDKAAALIDIKLLDHLILCDGYYYSYADEGRLEG